MLIDIIIDIKLVWQEVINWDANALDRPSLEEHQPYLLPLW